MAATTKEHRRAVFPIFLWGFILFCVFGLLAIAAVRWFGNFQTYDELRAVERARVLAEYRKTMDANLNTLKWADQQKQVAQIPISEAMKITVKRLNAKEVSASSVVIAPPPPSANATPAAPLTDGAASSAKPAQAVPAPASSPSATADPASGVPEAPQHSTKE
jgi:hypothetical protein